MTILNACTKKSGTLLKVPRIYLSIYLSCNVGIPVYIFLSQISSIYLSIYLSISVCLLSIYLFIYGNGWLGNQGIQFIMEANYQGRERKEKPNSAPPKNYIPFSIYDVDVKKF